MKTIQATTKPPYNDWVKYIHSLVRNQPEIKKHHNSLKIKELKVS